MIYFKIKPLEAQQACGKKKKCLASLIIGKMQIKTTIKHHLATDLREREPNNYWQDGEKRRGLHFNSLQLCHCRKQYSGSFKNWNRTTTGPAIPLLVTCPGRMKPQYWRIVCTPTFVAALFTVAKKLEQPKCLSTEDELRKYGSYTYGSYLTIKNGEIVSCDNIMEFEVIVLKEISQDSKGKYCIISFMDRILKSWSHRS